RQLGRATLLLCWLLATTIGVVINLGIDSSHYYAQLVTGAIMLEAFAIGGGLAWLAHRVPWRAVRAAWVGGRVQRLRQRGMRRARAPGPPLPPAVTVPAPLDQDHRRGGWAGRLTVNQRARVLSCALLATLLAAALLTRFVGLNAALTTDEGHWMQRTVRFG